MKLNIPEIKIPEIKIPEVKIPKLKLPKGGLPKLNIPRIRRKLKEDEPETDEAFSGIPDDEEPVFDDIPDEPSDADAAEDVSEEAAEDTAEPKPQKKVKSYGMVISEDQLRMVWAGEIGFSLLAVFAAVLIAIAS